MPAERIGAFEEPATASSLGDDGFMRVRKVTSAEVMLMIVSMTCITMGMIVSRSNSSNNNPPSSRFV